MAKGKGRGWHGDSVGHSRAAKMRSKTRWSGERRALNEISKRGKGNKITKIQAKLYKKVEKSKAKVRRILMKRRLIK